MSENPELVRAIVILALMASVVFGLIGWRLIRGWMEVRDQHRKYEAMQNAVQRMDRSLEKLRQVDGPPRPFAPDKNEVCET